MNKAKKDPGASNVEVAVQKTGNVQANDTFSLECMQGHFVAWRREWDAEREVWKKVPHNGRHRVSTKKPEHWTTLEHALALAADPDNDLAGIGLVMTGGIRQGDFTLVGIDVDDATADFVLPFDTYCETSPSGNGYRAFVWLPTTKAALLRDTRLDDIEDCDHVEVYIGTAPRFLTLTFDQPNGRPIAYVDDLSSWKLNKAVNLITQVRPIVPGAMLELDDYQFRKSVFLLLDGEGQPVIDRNVEVHNLIIALADQGASEADILATLVGIDATWVYLMDHRRDDPERAQQFAREEVQRCYQKSMGSKVKGLFDLGVKLHAGPPHGKQPLAEMMADHARGFEAPYLAALWDDNLAIDWMLSGVLENQIIAEIWGPPGTYKSFVALDMAVAVASGQDWHGHKVKRSGEVLYICGEGRRNIGRRLRAVCQERGLGRDLKIRITNMPVLLSRDDEYKWLREYIAGLPVPPALIIIDTLARNYGGNENSAEDMGRFLDNLGRLSREFRSTILIIHHCGLDDSHSRGSSALHAGVDAEYKTVKGLIGEQRTLTLENVKMKDAEEGKHFGFHMNVVTLLDEATGAELLDDEGEPITSLALETGESLHVADRAAFLKEHPEFKNSGRSKAGDRFPLVLRYAYASPGMSARAMAQVVTPKLQDHSWATGMHRLMLDAKLVEGDGFKLTTAGERVAVLFDCHAEFAERTKGLPVTPVLTVEKVTRNAQLL